ncbi:hypothetical protein [Candidatus Poriferisodalis sp.]|uniref:hypothetical protein n=1 Tax=Candidatus Poriferisodalis sp. TaxID=3101277 RepID=UPI003B02E45D
MTRSSPASWAPRPGCAAKPSGGVANTVLGRLPLGDTASIGGFGHLLLFCFDYSETPESAEAWRRSMELLAHDVMPRVAHLTGD